MLAKILHRVDSVTLRVKVIMQDYEQIQVILFFFWPEGDCVFMPTEMHKQLLK